MNRLSFYERETLLLKLGITKEDKYCWNFMNDLLIRKKYKKFLILVVDSLCDIRRELERIEEENDN